VRGAAPFAPLSVLRQRQSIASQGRNYGDDHPIPVSCIQNLCAAMASGRTR
jgi:hypothetical protein